MPCRYAAIPATALAGLFDTRQEYLSAPRYGGYADGALLLRVFAFVAFDALLRCCHDPLLPAAAASLRCLFSRMSRCHAAYCCHALICHIYYAMMPCAYDSVFCVCQAPLAAT